MKKVLKTIGIVLGIIILIPVLFILYLRIRMFDPEAVEPVEYTSGSDTVSVGDTLSVLTFNIGYAGYDADVDFFMDGGKGVLPESRDEVTENLSGISSIITGENCDITMLQELDVDSRRSFHTNELAYLGSSTGKARAFACNYDVVFIPYPIPPMGKVYSGIATFTDLGVTEAQRIALPDAAAWYMSVGYMKRCLLVERIPVEGSEHELVIINHHLEAYTDEDKRDGQMTILGDLIAEEYSKGNYVVVGGDFNQEFSVNNNPPIISETGWIPGAVTDEEIPDGFRLAVADNAPTCRSLEEPFVDNETSQVYIIDGFLVSDNLEVKSVEVRDYGFESSDHNPVRLEIRIRP